jgi:2-polyprenyl-3-methyl-5-hydroxy-6-metoxy-1,4-benzoquinol methylase
VAKTLWVGEALLAVEGLALSRSLFQGTDDNTRARLVEIRNILLSMGDPESIENQSVNSEELTVAEGYDLWAATYDDAVSPIVDVEQPVLTRILESFPKGRATDVCCGTGRVTELLQQLGHQVTGLDQSPEMLMIAAQKNPSIEFKVHQLESYRLTEVEQPQDLVTCAMALAHFRDLTSPLRSISALLRPGASAVLTTPHPVFVSLDGQAFFNAESSDPDAANPNEGTGRSVWIRNHRHQISDYLRAFQAAGLTVTTCEEVIPPDGAGLMSSFVGLLRPEAAREAYLGLPMVLLWVLRKPESA